jgi:hypothetical protein
VTVGQYVKFLKRLKRKLARVEKTRLARRNPV